MAQVNVKFRVHCVDSERGWGQDYWHVDFDTMLRTLQVLPLTSIARQIASK
jgi:hypothetical protein